MAVRSPADPVGDDGGPAVRIHFRDVVVIAAYLMRRYATAACPQPPGFRQVGRQQTLLDGPRQAQFLFQLAFTALLFEEAGVFQDGRGFDSQRLEQLAISAGQVSGGDAGIHI